MKAVLASQFTITQCQGKYYTKAAFASILLRYAAGFGRLTLCVPFCRAEQPEKIWEDVSEAVDQIIPVSRNESILGLKKNEMRRAIRESDLTIVRCHSFVAFRASDLAHRAGKPVLAEAMACPWDAMWNHGFLGKLVAPYMYLKMKQVMRQANYAIYVTEQFLQRRYPCLNPSIGASNVALPPASSQVRSRRLKKIQGMNTKQITLMTCAAVDVRHKGQEYVIRALPLLAAKGIRAVYYCVGQGDPGRLKKLANETGTANQVVFTGAVPHEQVFDLLDQCDIYLQPSLQEGLPRALIEAMSRGCPCIGAKTAGIPELLPRECLTARRATSEIAERISTMLETGLTGYAKQNFERARQFSASILDERRNAYFDKIRRELTGGDEGGPV